MAAQVSSAAPAAVALYVIAGSWNSYVLFNLALFTIPNTLYQCDNLLKFRNPYAVHVQDITLTF